MWVAASGADLRAAQPAVDNISAERRIFCRRIGPQVGLAFVERAAFGRAFKAGNRRRDRVHAFVVRHAEIESQVVIQVAVTIARRVDGDLLAGDGFGFRE